VSNEEFTEPVPWHDARMDAAARPDRALEPVEITAGRLHLRPWTAYDVDAVLGACQDPDIQRWTQVPSPYTPADARTYVTQTSPQGWSDGSAARFAVLDAVTGGLLGSVGLHAVRLDARTAEIGYWTAAPARRQGVTSEAAATLCRWGFGALGLHRIVCFAELPNVASQRAALRAGFRYEGVARGEIETAGGERVDAWQAALLATD
jgi:RimJ/RimL family protein N-acetyltransferase